MHHLEASQAVSASRKGHSIVSPAFFSSAWFGRSCSGCSLPQQQFLLACYHCLRTAACALCRNSFTCSRCKCLLKRGGDGHLRPRYTAYMYKYTHGVLRWESFCWSRHTPLPQITIREDQALLSIHYCPQDHLAS